MDLTLLRRNRQPAARRVLPIIPACQHGVRGHEAHGCAAFPKHPSYDLRNGPSGHASTTSSRPRRTHDGLAASTRPRPTTTLKVQPPCQLDQTVRLHRSHHVGAPTSWHELPAVTSPEGSAAGLTSRNGDLSEAARRMTRQSLRRQDGEQLRRKDLRTRRSSLTATHSPMIRRCAGRRRRRTSTSPRRSSPIIGT